MFYVLGMYYDARMFHKKKIWFIANLKKRKTW